MPDVTAIGCYPEFLDFFIFPPSFSPNGKRYDTEKAERLGSYSTGYPRDFNYICETLYRKRTGELFLHGEGGAASKYARTVAQNEWCGGERIMPLSYEAAQEWAEDHMDGDEYESVFGEVEDDPDDRVRVMVSRATMERIKREAAKTGKPLGEVADDMVARAAQE